MYTNDKHIIKKELFEFEIENKGDVSFVQKSVAEILSNKVPSIIDEICSKYSNDEIIQLDKIEINLEEIDLENIEEQIMSFPLNQGERIKRIYKNTFGEEYEHYQYWLTIGMGLRELGSKFNPVV